MSLNSVTPDSDASNVTPQPSVTRNGAPMSNAERQRLYRERRKAQAQQGATIPEPAPSTKPKKPRPGGHKLKRANPDAPKRPCPPTPIAEKPYFDPRRPSLYTEDIAAEICFRLSHGETLTKICKDDHLPSRSTVLKWVNEDPEFGNRFARARDLQFEHWADNLVDVAAEVRDKPEQVPAARLDSENKRWLLARLKPSLYSEKFQADVTTAGQPLQAASSLDLAKALAAALQARALPAPETIIEVEATEVPTESEGERS